MLLSTGGAPAAGSLYCLLNISRVCWCQLLGLSYTIHLTQSDSHLQRMIKHSKINRLSRQQFWNCKFFYSIPLCSRM